MEQLLGQILVLVANSEMRTIKAEVEKGFMWSKNWGRISTWIHQFQVIKKKAKSFLYTSFRYIGLINRMIAISAPHKKRVFCGGLGKKFHRSQFFV